MSDDVESKSKNRYKTKNIMRFRLSSFNSGKRKKKLFKHSEIFLSGMEVRFNSFYTLNLFFELSFFLLSFFCLLFSRF